MHRTAVKHPPRVIMKRSWLTSVMLGGVILLLTLFLGLQYNWLQQVGDAERARMQKRIDTDTKALADEFNREIQAAFFNFQVGANAWQNADFAEFNERYDFWKGNTAYPTLIREIIYFPKNAAATTLRYNAERRAFESFEPPAEIANIREQVVRSPHTPVVETPLALVLPIRDGERRIEQIRINRGDAETINIRGPEGAIGEPEGHLAVVLDRETLVGRMLPDLQQKYFPTGEFQLAVTDRSGNAVLGNRLNQQPPDATADLLSLRPDNLLFLRAVARAFPRSWPNAEPAPS